MKKSWGSRRSEKAWGGRGLVKKLGISGGEKLGGEKLGGGGLDTGGGGG